MRGLRQIRPFAKLCAATVEGCSGTWIASLLEPLFDLCFYVSPHHRNVNPISDFKATQWKRPYRCIRCARRARIGPSALTCTACGFSVASTAGFFDLLPARAQPRFQVFDTAYGALYDTAISNRGVATVGGKLMWGADMPRVFSDMARYAATHEGEVVLDVPAGGGVTLSWAPFHQGLLVGADLSGGMLRRAAARRRSLGLEDHVSLCRADASELPLLDRSVDRIVSFMGLHVISEQAAALVEFRRVLRPGRLLIGTTLVADAPPPWLAAVRLARLSGFFVPPDAGALERYARQAGFKRWRAERTGALLHFRAE